MGVIVRYKNKAILTYSLNAHAPWEGYRVCFNGTKGRLEFNVVEVSSSSADGKDVKVDFPGAHPLETERAKLLPEIIFQPHWGKPYVIDYPEVAADADHVGDFRVVESLGDVVQHFQLARRKLDLRHFVLQLARDGGAYDLPPGGAFAYCADEFRLRGRGASAHLSSART